GCLIDGVRGKWRRHEHHRGVGGGLLDRLVDGVEDRDPLDVLTTLAGGHPTHEIGAVGLVPKAVKGALAPGEALNHELGAFVNQYRHAPIAPFPRPCPPPGAWSQRGAIRSGSPRPGSFAPPHRSSR